MPTPVRVDKVREWNKENFIPLLPEEKYQDSIESLINSGVSYHDLKKLLDLGCDKDLAIEILV